MRIGIKIPWLLSLLSCEYHLIFTLLMWSTRVLLPLSRISTNSILIKLIWIMQFDVAYVWWSEYIYLMVEFIRWFYSLNLAYAKFPHDIWMLKLVLPLDGSTLNLVAFTKILKKFDKVSIIKIVKLLIIKLT